jgi:hypothetical protein
MGDETELWRNAVNKNLSDAAENQTTVKEPVFLPTFFSIKRLPLN